MDNDIQTFLLKYCKNANSAAPHLPILILPFHSHVGLKCINVIESGGDGEASIILS